MSKQQGITIHLDKQTTGVVLVLLAIVVGVLAYGWSRKAEGAKNEFGYNYTARIFNGTGNSWCLAKYGPAGEGCMTLWGNDKLVMKWNAEWDRGNDTGWAEGPYHGAWTDNEWNGMFPGGSGSVWHYKIKWVGNCVADPTLLPAGAYCVWGQFATVMDQGVDMTSGPVHTWFAKAIPGGYGVVTQ